MIYIFPIHCGADEMDVKTLCLGILCQGEASGYEIKKHFEDAFRHFFSAGYGSIYPALNQLAEQGLITCREVRQQGRPDKKLYRITAAGRAAFSADLAATPPRHKARSEFLVLMYFADLLSPERRTEVLEQRLEQLREQVAALAALDDSAFPPGPAFTLGFGRAVLGAALEYVEGHRERLLSDLSRPDSP